MGISPQISKTIENVSQLSKELGGKEITFVGHSFGAVPATVGSIMTGQKAITFNPAHLGGMSQLIHGLDIEKANVTNYISSMGNIISDPVTHLQNSVSWLLGNKIIGSQINVPVNGLSHSIEDICKALEPK